MAEKLVALVIHEAHCCKKWGDEFRKDFSKLGDFCGFILKNVKFMALALSAAMSKSTWRDVSRILGMSKPVTIAKSPDKPNLVYSLIEKSEMEEVFHSVIEELKAKRLQMESRMGVVIATVAFRLGTDCPNVCKETGWAGQDGQLSFATLCYNGQDISFAFMEKEIVEYWPPKENCLKCGKAIPIAELKSHISMCEKSLVSIIEELQCSMEGETFEMVDGAPLRLFARSVYHFTCGIEPSKINSEHGSNERARKNQGYMYFIDYLDDCEVPNPETVHDETQEFRATDKHGKYYVAICERHFCQPCFKDAPSNVNIDSVILDYEDLARSSDGCFNDDVRVGILFMKREVSLCANLDPTVGSRLAQKLTSLFMNKIHTNLSMHNYNN
uniref:Uncharacterized protein n=2 Tax=Amphimedon queenslandica TaxID=400682 RepID=A0A1X7VAA9_AMPQE